MKKNATKVKSATDTPPQPPIPEVIEQLRLAEHYFDTADNLAESVSTIDMIGKDPTMADLAMETMQSLIRTGMIVLSQGIEMYENDGKTKSAKIAVKASRA